MSDHEAECKFAPTDGQRKDNSLGILTTQFLSLLESAPDRTLDVKEAAKVNLRQILNIKRRRIYDITNVLKGVNVIKKKSKNTVQMIKSSYEAGPVSEEEKINTWTSKMHKKINNLYDRMGEYLYLTADDIDSLVQENSLIIRTSDDTVVQVKPVNHTQNDIEVKSQSKEIIVLTKNHISH